MGHRVEQGKPAVPTEAVAAAKAAGKQVSRVPVGKAVRSLTAKAGVLKKTTKKTTGKQTSAKKTTAKKTAARKPAATRSLSRPALPSEIQTYITFTGGSSANSQSIDAANELMEVLKSPTAIGVMRSQRIEPGK